jgi:hypothetical protein
MATAEKSKAALSFFAKGRMALQRRSRQAGETGDACRDAGIGEIPDASTHPLPSDTSVM